MSGDLGSVPPEQIIISEVRLSDTFRFHLTVGHQCFVRFGSDATSEALKTLSNALRDERVDECRQSFADYESIPIEERDEFTRNVIVMGHQLFRKMIPVASDRETFRSILSANAGKTIRVAASGVCIPWEALCLAEDVNAATFKDFLGWNHPIARHVEFPYGRADKPPTVMTRNVGLIEDENLPSVRALRTRQVVDNIGSGIVKVPLRALTVPADHDHFLDFFDDEETPKQVIQFDCHVKKPDVVRYSQMRMTRSFYVPFQSFEEKLEVLDEPFVFLNACSGGSIGWDDTDGYAGSLHAAGAVLVVAAEADLGDDFMTDFAGSFYLAVHDSSSVAEALLKARRVALDKYRNPSALFYSLYGDTRFQLGASPLPLSKMKDLQNMSALVAKVWPPKPGPEPDYRRHSA